MAKTVETLGVVMTLVFSKLFFTYFETEFFRPGGEMVSEKNSPRIPKKTCDLEGRGDPAKKYRVSDMEGEMV